MCGKAYDPRLIVAWPSAELAVMSGNSAAKVLLQIEKASLEKKGEKITPEKITPEKITPAKAIYPVMITCPFAGMTRR